MGKLLKYEIRKSLPVKLMILGLATALELVFLIGLWGDNEKMLATGVLLLTFTAVTATTVVGLASVVILHRDMNTKQSYMLFMTPNSCYRILGAKVLENGVSILLTGAFFFALGTLDITLLFAKQGQLADLWKMIRQMLSTLDSRLTLDFPVLAAFAASLLLTWVGVISAAYLGEVISAALLNGKRFNGVVSFLLILLLLFALSWIQRAATRRITELIPLFLTDGAIALVASALMYFLTAQIMERRLSV